MTEKKKSPGRPTKYDPKFCEEIISYFTPKVPKVLYKIERWQNGQIKKKTPVLDKPPRFCTFAGFASSIGVHVDTLLEWCEKYKDFKRAYGICKQLQEDQLVAYGMEGSYNANFARFFAINRLGYSSKDVDDVGPSEIEVSFVGEEGEQWAK